MESIRRIILLLLVLTLASCAGSLKPEAFKKPKTLALVIVSGRAEGLATTEAEDNQLLNNLALVSINELDRSPHIRVVPEAAVKGSKAYKAIKDQGAPMFQDLARGYKQFDPRDETANLKRLAKELKVDGFVTVMAQYGTVKSGAAISGFLPVPIPVSIGRVKPRVTYTIVAFDTSGEVFWQDMAEITSDEGITTALGIGQYQALHPKLVTLTKAACKQVVTNLDQSLAAK